MLHLVLFSIMVVFVGGKPHCGGIFTAARGILQTPGFPNELPVPLQCEWIIDAQHLSSSNTSIIVYLTQLYVHEGLSFTEYQVYDRTYQLDGHIIHTVNETNVVQVRWVQSFQNYLVISLKIDDIDSTHMRVLDKFLNVFGFNITYEITRNSVRSDSCTMMDCGFTGICYDHFNKFSCDCFPGYAGPHCSLGGKSFCTTDGKPTCKNGATCIHVGVSAVKCYCQKGFTGDTCQIPTNTIIKTECDNCVISCSFNGQIENACWCNKYINSTIFTDRLGFTVMMHLSNLPNLKGNSMKFYVENQILKTLKMNYSKVENVTVDNIIHYRSGADITFHFFAMKKDEKRVKTILTKWADRGYIANLTVVDKLFVFRPLLDLQSVSLNQMGVIREKDEFILSCVARGSPTMTFRWYKDGIFVNVTEMTSHKWSRLIKDPHIDDQYTALLGIERSNILDEGLFTCQVEDFHIQQCLSRRVKIRAPPIIKIEPMSLTVRKGENLTIKCISIANDNTNKYTYSWTKNRELLPVRTNNEKYEILYPGGSILQIFAIERSVKYSCLVQDEVVSGEVTVNINVVDPTLVQMCRAENYLQIQWPETAPDTDSLQECPKGFYSSSGFVRRSCILSDGRFPVWQEPDYSHCSSKFIFKLEHDFHLLRLGYEIITPTLILENCFQYLQNSTVFPGEGARILSLIREILLYTKNSLQIHNVFGIINKILSIKSSIVNQEQIKLLQQVVNNQINMFDGFGILKLHHLYHLTFPSIDILVTKSRNNVIKLLFNSTNNNQNWRPFEAQIYVNHLTENNDSPINSNYTVLAVVIYKNLTAFLPMRSVIRLNDGVEIEYEILSQVLRLWPLSQQKYYKNSITSIILDWKHDFHDNNTRDGWYIKCAVAEAVMYGYSWDTSICETHLLNSTNTRCICPSSGTFSILLTTNNIRVEKEESQPTQYVVLAGCSICFLSALICSIILIIYWLLKHSYIIFLKIQCTLSVGGVMLTFVLVIISEPNEKSFTNILSLLEILLLMGISAHVSTLLIIYIELVELPKTTTSKEMVIGISTGVPIIAVFGNHLAHRTMDVRLHSWWLLISTLAFHIFITVTIVITTLFVLLYFIVIKKLNRLIYIHHNKQAKALQKRMLLVKRSACIFCCLIIAIISSVLYINFLDSVWLHYEFCTAVMLLGFVLVMCYIVRTETELSNLLHEKFKSTKANKNIFGNESIGSPLNFFTKEEAELESESVPNRKPDIQRNSPNKINECYAMTDIVKCKSRLPECVSGTMELSFVPDGKINRYEYDQLTTKNDLELYNKSPQLFRKSCINFQNDGIELEPDIISNKICTELDLIASHAPSIILTPDEAINKIITTSSLTQIEEKNSEETVTDDDNEGIITTTTTSGSNNSVADNKDKLDGMLDRISHDLDYLLNRSSHEGNNAVATSTTQTATGNIRKISKPPGLSVIQQIQEEIEEEVKLPDSITDILRTSC